MGLQWVLSDATHYWDGAIVILVQNCASNMSENELRLDEKLANTQGGEKKAAFHQSKSPSPHWQQLEDNAPQQPASFQHYKFCAILMIMAFLGALSMQIGLWIGPDDCDNDNFFEIIGGLALWISAFGIPINGLIFLGSLSDREVHSGKVFLWSIAHVAVLFLTLMFFIDAILQDLFCGSGGPHYDIGAGF